MSYVVACSATVACSTCRRNAFVSSAPGARSARGNARRRTAWSRQTRAGCRYAPRPGSVPRGSGTHASSLRTIRRRSFLAARSRHPTQVRSGHAPACVRPDTVKSTSPHRPHPFGAKIERLLSIIQAPHGLDLFPGGRFGRRPVSGALLRRLLGVGPDVDAPAGEPGGEAGVLALLADRQRQLVVRHGHPGGAGGQVDDLDLAHPSG